jgi:hypothetical protein
MPEVETRRFTVGVFQDVKWAERGIEALKRRGFPAEALSVLAKESPEIAALIKSAVDVDGVRLDLRGVGAVIGCGPLIESLQGDDQGLSRLGIASTMRRVGFQAHDGRIFETLTARGGVLVAIVGEPRAADALALLHSYGGGNAAIGAWTGRV